MNKANSQTAVAASGRVDDVIEALDPEVARGPAEALRDFGRRLLARASAEFLESAPPREIAGHVEDLYRFVEAAGADEIAVRVLRAPGRTHRALVYTVMPDCSFIVDTLRENLHAEGLGILYLHHPVLVIERDRKGRIVQIRDRTVEGPRTSVVSVTLDGQVSDERIEELEADIRDRLHMVRRVTSDFGALLEQARDIHADLEEDKKRFPWRIGELAEVQDLLEWLQRGCFVFLGYRAYEIETDETGERMIRVQPDSGLGILREGRSRYAEPTPLDEMPPELRARIVGGPLLIVSKTNSLSPVHRRAPMDDISIKKMGPDGEVEGERRFLGLFTAKAFQQDASNIPILRRKLREILEAEDADVGSHDHGLIVRIYNSLPKEELFLTSVPELVPVVEAVMESEADDEVHVFARPDALGRGANLMVILPKHKFSGEVRLKIQEALLEETRGTLLNYHLALGEGDQARLHFYIGCEPEEVEALDLAELERRVRTSIRSWSERLSDALEERHDVEKAHELADRHQGEFPAEYRASVDVETAVEDIEHLGTLETSGLQQVVLEELDPSRRLRAGRAGTGRAALLKVFARQGFFVLSDVMPILENLGFRVVEAEAFDVGSAETGRASTIHTFVVETPAEWEVDREQAEGRVAAAFRAVQNGDAEDDRLNSLVLSAGLEWRAVALLRAYAGYAFRIGAVSSRQGVRRPLIEHPAAARLLFGIFAALHDPALGPPEGEARLAEVDRRSTAFQRALEAVRGIEDDRAYRRLLNLVQATVRTSFFQARAHDRSPGTIALKFDCERIEVMPRPRPRFEVYVQSARTEAAHLRMDAVARGGIRWSDRSEDFRVEVLGLVKTQQVKNAVIVPSGAKGAYVVSRPPAGREARLEAGAESYRELIRAMLDLTDNVSGGAVVHPPDTVIRDGEDPYLVVAADKGTARFSDMANGIAAEYGHWLGDAFASGGSSGYDHKELGITARGAWECVRRHFRELGTNVDQESFTAAGIGDMSGDVFGNGMLLSRRIRLVAAFDHRHIFLDPDPDPEASWRERKRLYELAGSSWADYDPALISAGGGVWERGAKRIPVSPEAQALLGIEDEEVNGDALIRAVLRARVDLLWNGGIGTYVKASTETQGDVGDPSNDAVRVDGRELRCRVVGEGGNLGLTQAARVEYALGGGRLNTDALDNSAGVDMSDHEVNLKVLLNDPVDRGVITLEQRNALLGEVAEEVTRSVLAHNYWQSLAVSLDEHRVQEQPAEFRDALVLLERTGILDRNLEFLPSTEALIERHEERGKHLTRPELAILLAYAKMHLRRSIGQSEVPDDPALAELFHAYFPPRALEVAGRKAADAHRLQRRITSTVLTNLLVDRLGATGHIRLARETGHTAADIARAAYIAHCMGDAGRLYEQVQRLDGSVPAGVQIQAFLGISQALGRATRWILANSSPEWTIGKVTDWFCHPIAELRAALPRVLTERRRSELESRERLYLMDGFDEETAAGLASLELLDELLPVAELARDSGVDAAAVGSVYFGLTDVIDFPWLQGQLGRIPGADLWEQRAAKTLAFELEASRARMAASVVRDMGENGASADAAIDDFRRRFAEPLGRARQVMDDLRALDRPSLSALMVAVHAISEQSAPRNGGRG